MNDPDFSIYNILYCIAKWKRLLLLFFLGSLISGYLTIYFFVDEEYQSSATILPSSQSKMGMEGLLSLANKFSDFLPTGSGKLGEETLLDLFNTIIYSRTFIENLVEEFDLDSIYNFKSMEKGIRGIRNQIETKVTLENAFEIRVRMTSPELARDLANYIVQELNKRVIDLNVSKARQNREFIEKRYNKIKTDLKIAENSLQNYQESNNIFEAKEQAKTTLEAIGKFEAELEEKLIELKMNRKFFGEKSNKTYAAKIAVEEYKNTLNKLKHSSENRSVIVPLNNLPQTALEYVRLYRDVEIFNKMLEIVIPILEQAKFEEQKVTPVLNIIDKAISPEKRIFPQRTITATAISLILTFVVFSFLYLFQFFQSTRNSKIIALKNEFLKF